MGPQHQELSGRRALPRAFRARLRLPGAEFLVAAGEVAVYPGAGHLASPAVLATVAKDFGPRPAVIARTRRVNVLWTLLRGNRPSATTPPARAHTATAA